MSKTRYILFPLMVTATVLLQLAMPVVARADDGTPPTDEPTEVAVDPGTATPVPVVEPTATEVPVTPEAPLLAQVPEGTEVVVLNADGSVEPLATQAAADVIASSDPVWCQDGYTPGDDPDGSLGYCTPDNNSVETLIQFLQDNSSTYSGDGTIYFEEGNYISSETSIYLDQTRDYDANGTADLALLGNLGLEGGWSLDASGSAKGTTTGTTVFSVPIWVLNWDGSITIKDIEVANTDTTGLFVDATGDVAVTDSTFTGNYQGVEIVADGDVSLTNVTVDNEYTDHGTWPPTNGDGATIQGQPEHDYLSFGADGGTYTLSCGADTTIDLDYDASAEAIASALNDLPCIQAAGGVSVSGAYNSEYMSGNWGIYFSGYVNQPDISADSSGLIMSDGSTYLHLEVSNGALPDAVTVTGGSFNNTGGNGLEISAGGDVTLQGLLGDPIQALGNYYNGVSIDNSLGSGWVGVSDLSAGGNRGDGIYVYSNGAISLDSVLSASVTDGVTGNGSGAYLGNTNGSGDIQVTNSIFSDNQYSGLSVYSSGAILLNTVAAEHNRSGSGGGWGAYLSNDSGTVTVLNSSFQDNGTGVNINTNGTITLANVIASYNLSEGVYIDGSLAEAMLYIDAIPGDAFTLSITTLAHGTETTTALPYDATAQEVGDALNALAGIQDAGGVQVYRQYLSDYNRYSWTIEYVAGYGHRPDFSLDSSDLSGFYNLWNMSGRLPGDIGITGSHFDANGTAGIDVYASGGTLLLGSVTASGNGASGAYLDNTLGNGTVTITNSTFSGNSGETYMFTAITDADGLDVLSNGAITLTDVTARGNLGNGAYLIGKNAPITITGSPTTDFSGNGGSGLYLTSNGAITLGGVLASSSTGDGNSGDGVRIAEQHEDQALVVLGYEGGTYTLTFGSATTAPLIYNASPDQIAAALNSLAAIQAAGGVEVSSLEDVYGPGIFEIVFANSFADQPQVMVDDSSLVVGSGDYFAGEATFYDGKLPTDVIVSGGSFDHNSGNGLDIAAGGNVIFSTPYAENNAGDGAYIDNTYGTGLVDIGSGGDTFNANTGNGLVVYSSGTISTLNIVATNNGQMGAILDNTSGGGAAINITGGNFSDNGWTGLDAYSSGTINVSAGFRADGNEDGAFLEASTGSGDIFVSNAILTGNTFGGLTAWTAGGSLNLMNVTATNNLDYGAGLSSLDGGYISVTGGAFDNNGTKGLWIETPGDGTPAEDILLSGVGPSSNGLKGAYIHYMAPCGTITGGLDLTVDAGLYQNNAAFGVYAVVGPDGSMTLVNSPTGGGNGDGSSLYDFYADDTIQSCPIPSIEPEGKSFNIVNVTEAGAEGIPLDCANYIGTVLVLPDGDRATLVCTVTGIASLVSQKNDNLPGSLPGGDSFVSGMNVTLTKNGVTVTVITEGGFVTVAIPIPADKKDAHFAILYWDPAGGSGTGAWVELPPYETRPDGTPMVHALHPDLVPDDLMRIYGGVRMVGDFVKVSVNFPGIFVLVTK